MRGDVTAQYVRVSSEAQAKRYGPDSQRQDISDACERNAFQPPGLAYEDHISAKGEVTRTDFLRMLADAERGMFRTLLVGRVDRFARNEQQAWNYVEQLIALGVIVYFCDEDVAAGLDDGWQDAVSDKFTAAAALSRTISRNITKAFAQKRKLGHFVGKVPWGWRRTADGRIEQDPVISKAIRRAGDAVLDNKKKLREIASDLTADGFMGPGGGPVTKFHLSGVLSNPLVCGTWRQFIADPELYRELKSQTEPIFSTEEYLRIRETLRARGQRKQHIGPVRHEYVFDGLLYCGEPLGDGVCAARYCCRTVVTNYEYTYIGYKHPQSGCMANVELRRWFHGEEYLLRLVTPLIRRLDPRRYEGRAEQFLRERADGAGERLARDRERLEAKKATYVAMLEQGIYGSDPKVSIPRYREAVTRIDAELAAMPLAPRIPSAAAAKLVAIQEAWQEATSAERNVLLGDLVARFYVRRRTVINRKTKQPKKRGVGYFSEITLRSETAHLFGPSVTARQGAMGLLTLTCPQFPDFPEYLAWCRELP